MGARPHQRATHTHLHRQRARHRTAATPPPLPAPPPGRARALPLPLPPPPLAAPPCCCPAAGSGLGVDLLSKVTCGRYTYTKPADEDGELPTSSSQDGSDDIMHQGPTKDVALAGKEVDALQPPAKQVVV